MKILLSHSLKHYDPEKDKPIIQNTTGWMAQRLYRLLSEFGDVDFISCHEWLEGKKYDLLYALPLGFWRLTKDNEFKKTICHINIAEPNFLYKKMATDRSITGCKMRDCFRPRLFYHADAYVHIGSEFSKQQYVKMGIAPKKINIVYRGADDVSFKFKNKKKKPVFLHYATTLGLRKGFWHVYHDFMKANLDAELWLAGGVTKEKSWVDLVKKAEKDPRITYFGFVGRDKMRELIYGSDFIVFPSWGDVQPGTLIEAFSGGCVPMSTKEAGFDYYPLGEYIRGDVSIWHRAYDLTNEEFNRIQKEMKHLIDTKYNIENYKNMVRDVVKKVIGIK